MSVQRFRDGHQLHQDYLEKKYKLVCPNCNEPYFRYDLRTNEFMSQFHANEEIFILEEFAAKQVVYYDCSNCRRPTDLSKLPVLPIKSS